jgi:diguanylate cyclase (GGDEF)-like protein/PAS domain S-box-containing protein
MTGSKNENSSRVSLALQNRARDPMSQIAMVRIKDGAYSKILQHQLGQVRQISGAIDLEALLDIISQTYLENDREIQMINRAMNLVSQELTNTNKSLEQRATELRAAKEQYELAIRGANDGLWDWDLKEKKVFYSPRWKEMLGYEEDEVFNSPDDWMDKIHPDYRRQVRAELDAHLTGHTLRFESEYQMIHVNGEYRWMLARGIALRDGDGKAIRISGSQTDITLRKQNEHKLQHAAFHDSLTGLPNRLLFLNRLEHLIAKVGRPGALVGAVLFLDLDRFKVINDSLGHMMGDNVLVGVTQRLKSIMRPGDTLARLSGDEFVFLLEDIHSIEEAEKVADRIAKKLAAPFVFEKESLLVSASIGIVGVCDKTLTGDLIMRNADLAMYEAKSLGRRRYAIFNQETQFYKVNQLQMEKDLHCALEKKELFLVYQPIVNISNNAIAGFEALIRWQHPTLGTVPPSRFISLAEESGLILPIGEYILETACEQLAKWRSEIKKAQDIEISVNLSINQLSDLINIERLLKIIARYKFPPHSLKIELTESVLAQNIDLCSQNLEKFKSHNIELCIDDFGTGFSSLSQLNDFPFDIVKIDRCFVSRMGSDDKTYRMVAGIINLSHDLTYKVVAEGVETIIELDLLRQLNCDYVQGYYFSKPVSAQEAEELIINGLPIKQETIKLERVAVSR